MRELNLLGATVDMDAKVSSVANWTGKESLESIDKIPMDAKSQVRLAAHDLLTVTTEVSVRVE
jgi:hypothetical protein